MADATAKALEQELQDAETYRGEREAAAARQARKSDKLGSKSGARRMRRGGGAAKMCMLPPPPPVQATALKSKGHASCYD